MCIYIIGCRLCFLSETKCNCVFFQKLNADLVFYPAVIGELMSTHPSLLEATIAIKRDDVSPPIAAGGHNSDGRADIITPIATRVNSSDMRLLPIATMLSM
jgi:hypothetical protein